MRLCFFYFLITCFISCHNKNDLDHLAIFKYNESSGINSLDPAFAKDLASVWATSQIFNGLVQLDTNLNVTPSIAKSWSISPNSLEYTFSLRNDVYFHDHFLFKDLHNRRVTAFDFEYSFSRLLDDNIISPGRWVMTNVSEFYAVNDSIFVIKLLNSFPAFLGVLSMQYCSVVPKIIVEEIDFHSNPIGTGPFKFQKWKKNEKLVLRKFENYFEKFDGKRLPFLDGVAITFLRDKQAGFLQFIMGKADFLSGIDASYKDELLTKDGSLNSKYKNLIDLQMKEYLNTAYLGFLIEDTLSPTKFLKIRQAINYGFDRRKMLKFLRNNIGTPAENGFIPKGLPSFNDSVFGYNYNPDLARELINDVKINVGSELGVIRLSTTSSYLDICEYIQNELLGLGLNVVIDVNPPSINRQMMATSKLSFFRAGWIADYPDAENYLSLFYGKNFSPSGPNYTHFKNDEFDKLYQLALSENNDYLRYNYYNKMDKIIIDNAVIVPLYYDKVLRFSHKNIFGLTNNPINMLNLKTVNKVLVNP